MRGLSEGMKDFGGFLIIAAMIMFVAGAIGWATVSGLREREAAVIGGTIVLLECTSEQPPGITPELPGADTWCVGQIREVTK